MSSMSRRGAVRSPSSVRMSENIRSEQSRASASDVTGRPVHISVDGGSRQRYDRDDYGCGRRHRRYGPCAHGFAVR